jgi:hypothetical protein
MSDDTTKATAETTEAVSTAEATVAEAPSTTAAAGPAGGPVPGDPSSEPVATAAQSHVPGRVGPPSIQQDSDATWHTGAGVESVAPGTELDAAYPLVNGPVELVVPDPATLGAGPYGGDTPPDTAPNVVTATKPGTEGPGADELPAGVPTASNASASGGPVTIPATSGGGVPSASPRDPSTSSTEPGPAVSSEPADSDGGDDGGSEAASGGPSDPPDAAGGKASTRKSKS